MTKNLLLVLGKKVHRIIAEEFYMLLIDIPHHGCMCV